MCTAGTIGAAEDVPALRARGIKAVVNISGMPSSKTTRKVSHWPLVSALEAPCVYAGCAGPGARCYGHDGRGHHL